MNGWIWRDGVVDLLDGHERRILIDVNTFLRFDKGTVIDSYEMGPEGRRITSVVVVNPPYIAEVSLKTMGIEFDVSRIDRLLTSRVHIEPYQFDSWGNPEYARIVLRHTDSIITEVSYFGSMSDTRGWVDFVLRLYPFTNPGAPLSASSD